MTRIRHYLGAVLACLLSVSLAHAEFGQPVECLKNGGFENGFEHWTPNPMQTIIENASQARSGQRCVFGEVTEPNQALKLIQNVEVKAGNLYDFSCYARATNRAKLVLYGTFPGEKTRRIITAWTPVWGKWARYDTTISVRQDGILQLEVIAPSSYGSPVGKMWIDDCSLLETAMPATRRLSDDGGYHDEPVMCAANDGTFYIAWNSFIDNADRLKIAHCKPKGDGFEVLNEWTVVHDPDVYVLTPTMCATEYGVELVYAAEVEKQWDIYCVGCDAEGPGEVLQMTNDPDIDRKPSVVYSTKDGRGPWVAYESIVDGVHRIRRVKWNEPCVDITGGEFNCYDPSIAVLADSNESLIAYHSYRDGNCDVYLKSTSTGMPPMLKSIPYIQRLDADITSNIPRTREHRLTDSPLIERHAELISQHGRRVSIAFERANVNRYGIGATSLRALIFADIAWHGRGINRKPSLRFPEVGNGLVSLNAEAPAMVADDIGCIWLAYRKVRGRHQGWGTQLTCYDPSSGEFMPARKLTTNKGMDRTPGLALVNGKAYIASQADDTLNRSPTMEQALAATSWLDITTVELPDAATPFSSGYSAPMSLPSVEFEPAAIRKQFGEDLPTPSTEYDGETLQLYFGDLHDHSDISICNRENDLSPDESYQHMRDIARHDFMCLTDHGYNMNPYIWNYSAKWARANDAPGKFVPFLGEEWTSTFEDYTDDHPHGYYGHRNLIHSDMYFPRWWNAGDRDTPSGVWEQLDAIDADYVHIPHQLADTGNVPCDHTFHDERSQPVAEIFQCRGSYEYYGAPRMAPRTTEEHGQFYQDMLADGLVIGAIAAPDHAGGYGKACVWAPELTREAILDALRARRCYGTTGAKIVLDVRIDGHMMGEKVKNTPQDPVDVKINVAAPANIQEIVVFRNNDSVFTLNPLEPTDAVDITFTDKEPIIDGPSWYYVRVILEDDEIAWSSPVWFGRE